MAATPSSRVTYVWISGQDTHHDLRSKDKVIALSAAQLALSPAELLASGVFPEWNFDGSSTAQALGKDTEIIIRPVAAWKWPLPALVPRFVVLCECFLPSGEPTPDNTRAVARTVFEAAGAAALEPWFGMEQEFVLMRAGRPVGWPAQGLPMPQGPYYCGNGPAVSFGRKLVDQHLEAALLMGLRMSGTNGEVMPGQWEFQVGPCPGIAMGDELVMARWLMLRLLEEDGDTTLDVTYRARPVSGDWNGSGLHTNFSTAPTRAPGGYAVIEEYLGRLAKSVGAVMPHYGADNNMRLTGKHETSRYDQFSYDVGTRTTSVRIPNAVLKDRSGYFEDRRPAGDADPYLVSARLFSSSCGIASPALDAAGERLRLPWMNF